MTYGSRTAKQRTCRSACLAIAAVLAIAITAQAEEPDRLFVQAVNYIFTGRIDPPDGPEITDAKSCIVVVPEPKFNRYARYYLNRIKLETARISKKYAGPQITYEWEVEGDDVIFEYLKPDKKTVDYGFRSAHIALPGNVEQTERAIALIYSKYCKQAQQKGPF
jgi:hypothetical protein